MCFFSTQTTFLLSLQADPPAVDEAQERDPKAAESSDRGEKHKRDEEHPQKQEEVASEHNNATTQQQKEGEDSSSEIISSSDSEKTLSESTQEPPKPYVTPGKAELPPDEQKALLRAKIAQVAKEMAEEEAKAKRKEERAQRRAEKDKRKAIRMAKQKDEEALHMLAARATSIPGRSKSGRNRQGPTPNENLRVKHSSLKKKEYEVIPTGDSEESLTDPAPLRQRRSKMKNDPLYNAEIPQGQGKQDQSNTAESEDSSPNGDDNQVSCFSLYTCNKSID